MIDCRETNEPHRVRPISRRNLIGKGGSAIVAWAVGMVGASSGPQTVGEQELRRGIPPGTEDDTRHRTLKTKQPEEVKDKKAVKRSWLIVTGYPEGANDLSTSAKSKLTKFFSKPKSIEGLTCAQIYSGYNIDAIEQHRLNLAHFLDNSPVPVEVAVYSLGATSLMSLDKKHWGKIKKLMLLSPFCGEDVVFGTMRTIFNLLGRRFTSEDYTKSIEGLVNYLHDQGVEVTLDLGTNDTTLANGAIQDAFINRFNFIQVTHSVRGHGIKEDELIGKFERSTTAN